MNQYPRKDWFPPLEPDQLQKAYEKSSEKGGDLWDQVREATEKALGGFWDKPPRERLAFYAQHEPLIERGLIGETLAPYWQMLYSIDRKETERMIADWKNVAKSKGL